MLGRNVALVNGRSKHRPLFERRPHRSQAIVIIPCPGEFRCDCESGCLLHKVGLKDSGVDFSPLGAQLANLRHHTVPSLRRALKRKHSIIRLHEDS